VRARRQAQEAGAWGATEGQRRLDWLRRRGWLREVKFDPATLHRLSLVGRQERGARRASAPSAARADVGGTVAGGEATGGAAHTGAAAGRAELLGLLPLPYSSRPVCGPMWTACLRPSPATDRAATSSPSVSSSTRAAEAAASSPASATNTATGAAARAEVTPARTAGTLSERTLAAARQSARSLRPRLRPPGATAPAALFVPTEPGRVARAEAADEEPTSSAGACAVVVLDGPTSGGMPEMQA